jgi:hypothetical protein
MTKEEIAKEIHTRILKEWSSKEQKLFFMGPYVDQSTLTQYHFALGTYIRNKYKLWEHKWTPELDHSGVDISPNHPDNLSFEIMKMIWNLGPNKVENG